MLIAGFVFSVLRVNSVRLSAIQVDDLRGGLVGGVCGFSIVTVPYRIVPYLTLQYRMLPYRIIPYRTKPTFCAVGVLVVLFDCAVRSVIHCNTSYILHGAIYYYYFYYNYDYSIISQVLLSLIVYKAAYSNTPCVKIIHLRLHIVR